MDFQAPNPAPEKASAYLDNQVLVSTSKGVVCLTLTDGISSHINLSNEDLKTVAVQLLSRNDSGNSTSITSFSDTTTVDSDDPTSSDCGAIRTQLILPPVAVKSLQHNKLGEIKPKRRCGWPKGRKRKPELLHLPPKAPATGYNLYLNERREHFKNSGFAFQEITKIVGNQWSNLSLEQKQPYLLRAEEDKHRYKDELRGYRQSGSYQLYLAKKRKKRLQNNILSESDMDATDDIDRVSAPLKISTRTLLRIKCRNKANPIVCSIGNKMPSKKFKTTDFPECIKMNKQILCIRCMPKDEDNEELYCRTCDQWFHNLHNKREHLQSRQHFQAVVGDMRSELESENERPAARTPKSIIVIQEAEPKSVSEIMVDLISAVPKREKDISNLSMLVQEGEAVKMALSQQLLSLKEREVQLSLELTTAKQLEKELESKVFDLWKVPSLFITTDLNYSDIEASEYSLTE